MIVIIKIINIQLLEWSLAYRTFLSKWLLYSSRHWQVFRNIRKVLSDRNTYSCVFCHSGQHDIFWNTASTNWSESLFQHCFPATSIEHFLSLFWYLCVLLNNYPLWNFLSPLKPPNNSSGWQYMLQFNYMLGEKENPFL